ncbi:hypothetical protein MNBD_GAMMA24-2216 [hydrothermal vent metagenome]|uniref:Uncharacterized protein n=1 Tax=hydrothermal vent metagenome TaxID=652676 RepID=A0A3B1CC09_9ZZZZ
MYPELASSELTALSHSVQKNCHISDAEFAGNYTLCIYLLKMREFYRWEKRHNFSATLSNSEVGNWLKQREALWGELEGALYRPLKIAAQQLDPFASDQINQLLQPHNLVYSGGLGRNIQPHFFLAERIRRVEHGNYSVLICGQEFARDLAAPPAMSQGRTIYIRRESLRRMLWEKIEEWRWNRPLNAMSRTLAEYDFSAGNTEAALEQLTDAELESALDHEIGEIMAQDQLGEAWEALLINLPHSKAEIMLRAIRDHLADALSTLPALLKRQQTASIHFYFANLNSMRKYLYPSLMAAYETWCQGKGFTVLRTQMLAGKTHWQALCEEILSLAGEPENLDIKSIEQRIEDSRL